MKTNKLWLFLLAALVLTTSCSSDDDEVLIGNWTKRSDFQGPVRSGASSFVIGNDAYLCLGFNDKERKKDLWVYDVKTGSWKQKANIPAGCMPRSGAVAFATDTKGYICSGYGGQSEDQVTYLKDLWEYNPTADAWTEKASLPGAVRADAVAAGLNNKGYVGAGSNDDGRLLDFYEYNPTTDEWAEKASIGGSKRQGGLSFVMNNTIYVGLGVNNGQYLTDLWAYNPATDRWTEKAKLRNATNESFDDKYNMQRAFGVAFVLGDRAYISLGESGSMRGDTWEYEPISDRWTQKTGFEGAARAKAVAFSVRDTDAGKQRAFIATGKSVSICFDDVWEFLPNDSKNDNDNDS